MRRITNISITDRAAVMLDCQLVMARPRPGEVFTLWYMSSYTNPDGTTVEGFRPGYAPGFTEAERITESWVSVQLPNRPQFCFWPRFGWDPGRDYVVDVLNEPLVLFSIEPWL